MKPLYYFAMAMMCATIAVELAAFYMVFWPVQVIEIKSVILTKKEYSVGEPISFALSYCKHVDSAPQVTTSLNDGITILLPDGHPQGLPLGCHTVQVNTVVIPEHVAPGRYYLARQLRYAINPLHTENASYRTEYFNIVASTTPAQTKIVETPVYVDRIQYVPVTVPQSAATSSVTIRNDPQITIQQPQRSESEPEHPAAPEPTPVAPSPVKSTVEKVLNLLPL